MDSENIKNFLKKHNLRPNQTYGQNFLMDEEVLDKIVGAAGVTSNDSILEVGPGIGNLTRKLLETGAFVLSVEKDPKFFSILKAIKKDFPKTFRYEIADILEFDYYSRISTQIDNADLRADPRVYPRTGSASISASYKVVANIPYYITGKILQMLLNAKYKPNSITVLTQKEVAERIMAKAGDLSVLAISVQIFGEPKIFGSVPASSFYPAPKVDSAILRVDLSEEPKFKIEDEKKFFRVVKACFAGKRKQIHNTLKNNLLIPKEQIEKILASLKINPSSRPQDLEIEEWVKLANLI